MTFSLWLYTSRFMVIVEGSVFGADSGNIYGGKGFAEAA